jgi:enolase
MTMTEPRIKDPRLAKLAVALNQTTIKILRSRGSARTQRIEELSDIVLEILALVDEKSIAEALEGP